MKHLALVLLMCVAVTAFAQEKKAETKKAETKETVLHGYVVDQMCAKAMAKKSDPMQRAARHTRECALEEACAASGYGLFYGNGKWVKFDANGDKLAQTMFEKSEKNNEFLVDVKGEVSGETFKVASLTEAKAGTDEKQKPAKEDHHGHDHK